MNPLSGFAGGCSHLVGPPLLGEQHPNNPPGISRVDIYISRNGWLRILSHKLPGSKSQTEIRRLAQSSLGKSGKQTLLCAWLISFRAFVPECTEQFCVLFCHRRWSASESASEPWSEPGLHLPLARSAMNRSCRFFDLMFLDGPLKLSLF